MTTPSVAVVIPSYNHGRYIEETLAPHGGLYFAFSGVDFLHEREDDTLDEWHDFYHQLLGQGQSFPTAGFALLRSNIAISASNFVMSRGLLDAVGGFDDRIKISQDWDFAVQALRFVEPTFIPEPLLTYRVHSRNTSRDAHLKDTSELDLVIDKLRQWIVRPTPNPRAPTAANWPRYFRMFACLDRLRTGRTLAAQLLPETLAESAETVTDARGTRAIRALISAARCPESIEDLSGNELMKRCQQTWTTLS